MEYETFYPFTPKVGDNPTSKTETILHEYQNHIHTLALATCQIYNSVNNIFLHLSLRPFPRYQTDAGKICISPEFYTIIEFIWISLYRLSGMLRFYFAM